MPYRSGKLQYSNCHQGFCPGDPMSDIEIFLRKMKGMSLIKAELMKLGKDPDIIERLLMEEYDRGEEKGISYQITVLDLDNKADIDKLMSLVLSRLK